MSKVIKSLRTKSEYEEIIKTCYSKADFCRALGIVASGANYAKVKKIIEDYNLDVEHFRKGSWREGKKIRGKEVQPIEYYLVENSTYTNTNHLKNRLISAGYKEHKCEVCGFEDAVELHHINGNSTDNRLENLQMLCPNCHAFTDNYRGKNIGMSAQEETPEVEAG